MFGVMWVENVKIPNKYNWQNIHETITKSLWYETFLVPGVLIALGSLTLWHARLISRGETSIEANINKAETKRLAEKNKVIVFYPYHIVKCVCM